MRAAFGQLSGSADRFRGFIAVHRQPILPSAADGGFAGVAVFDPGWPAALGDKGQVHLFRIAGHASLPGDVGALPGGDIHLLSRAAFNADARSFQLHGDAQILGGVVMDRRSQRGLVAGIRRSAASAGAPAAVCC